MPGDLTPARVDNLVQKALSHRPPALADPAQAPQVVPKPASPAVIRVSSKPTPTAPAVASGYTTEVTPVQLSRIVQKACGKLARQIRVERGEYHQLVVHVTGEPAAHESLVAALLSGFRSLPRTNVKLEVHDRALRGQHQEQAGGGILRLLAFPGRVADQSNNLNDSKNRAASAPSTKSLGPRTTT